MLTTDKQSCNILADLLVAHDVNEIVASPGSRNAPLIIALKRRKELTVRMVIDERSAAFMALGMSLQSAKPVALVCTSGSALLNYAPAIAESFYRSVPLIVISADRPQEWIDQDDSQTIWQQGALEPNVKRSYDIGAHLAHENGHWICERLINDAILEALSGRKGPVHINIRLDAPLNNMVDMNSLHPTRVIHKLSCPEEISTAEARKLGSHLASPKKILIIAGFHEPDDKLNRALIKLAKLPNVAVLSETISNLHSPYYTYYICRIDTTLCRLSDDDKRLLKPDVVITFGGALVSRHIKDWLRSLDNIEHWHIGHSHTTIDCFRQLTLRVDIDPKTFLRQLASAMQIHKSPSDYKELWERAYRKAVLIHDEYIDSAPWSDMKAMSMIISAIPPKWNLHFSNGTPIRYAQLMDCSNLHRCECNRGVSGIDGCTSTALGASLMYSGTTLLVSGDMSFQYDIAALANKYIAPRFKIIVMCNGGGGIFRFIGATSSLAELDECFVVGTNLPLKELSQGYGFNYFEASSEGELSESLKSFIEIPGPSILAIYTPPVISAEVLKQYFELQ